jgi:RNA polymerase sigma factor (sigma-70 family)
MPETDDIALLKQFAENESETAFAEIVSRHLALVYSTALRVVGNAHAAQEISQAVFIILARKAKSLGAKTILSGWLYQTTKLTAANYLRGEIRRQKREQEAFMQSTLNESESDAWRQIAPILDDAVSRLSAKDRDAIVLRFFENKSLGEVGAAIGASEDAAKMRVNRALEKLRKIFSKRGGVFSAAVIAGTVSANSVQAAPVGLAQTISATAVKGTAVAASITTLVKGTLKIMTYAKLKLALGVAVAALLTAGTMTVALSSGSDGNSIDSHSIGVASAQEKTWSAKIIQAVKDKDRQAFEADFDGTVKPVTESQFKALCAQTTPRLKAGYELVFLGALKQKGYHLTLWKVAFTDAGDDMFMTLSVKGGASKISEGYIFSDFAFPKPN